MNYAGMEISREIAGVLNHFMFDCQQLKNTFQEGYRAKLKKRF